MQLTFIIHVPISHKNSFIALRRSSHLYSKEKDIGNMDAKVIKVGCTNISSPLMKNMWKIPINYDISPPPSSLTLHPLLGKFKLFKISTLTLTNSMLLLRIINLKLSSPSLYSSIPSITLNVI